MEKFRSSRRKYDRFRQDLREHGRKVLDRKDKLGAATDNGEPKLDDFGRPIADKHERRRRRKRYLRQYWSVLRPFVWSIVGMFGLSVLAASLDMVQPWAIGRIVDLLTDDTMTTDDRLWWVNAILPCLLVLLVTARFVDVFRFYGTAALNSKIISELRRRVHHRMLRLSLGDIQQLKTGKIVSRISGDVDQAMGLLQQAVISPGVAVIRVAMTMSILFWMNWKLALVAATILPPVAVLSLLWVVKVRPIFKSAGEDRNETDARITETFGGIRVVRGFRREARELRDGTLGHHSMIRKRLFALRRAMMVDIFWEMVIPLVSLAIWWVGGNLYLVAQGEGVTIGQIVSFNMYAGMLMWPIARIVISLNQTQQSLAAVERVFEIWDLPEDKPDPVDALPAPPQVEQIRFDGVCFEYETGKPVIRDFNLTVPGGAVVALVGPSGAGKSTLTDLIARFHDPTDGAILLNGIDLRRLRLADYRAKLAIVQQDTFLFDGSVAENISYGRRSAPRDEVETAAKRANAHSFIIELPEGYDTVIGERGIKLSGGQRQRLSIARALLADPQILILDEATSNLDTESEQLIQAALNELYENRTTFAIAHRLSTVAHADTIVVIDRGEVIEVGSHDELMANRGMYHEMVTRQAGTFGDTVVHER